MKKIFAAVVIVVILAVGGAYFFLRSGLPDYSTDITAPDLSAPVAIERNRFAVPTITAQNLPDLFFAWGYVNGQDRLFQMEFTRRVGQGRISEFAGESALSKDVFLRAVDFAGRAKKAVMDLDPANAVLYQRYVDGVNHYLDTKGPNLYMKLMGMGTEKWEIADSIMVGMMLNWSLAYNMKHELLYHRIVRKIGSEKAAALMNYIPQNTPTIIEDCLASRAQEEKLTAAVKELDWLLGCRSASNNWAIGPRKREIGTGSLLTNSNWSYIRGRESAFRKYTELR
jgi:penicillin amidase